MLRKRGGEAVFVRTDVAKPGDAERAVVAMREAGARIESSAVQSVKGSVP
jgi:hypothetical protein